jgi:hypothetical protein
MITLFFSLFVDTRKDSLTFYVLRKEHENEAVFFVERLKRTVFVNTIILLFVKVFPSHA